MNPRQKTGLVIFFLGMILFLGQEFPRFFSIVRDYLTFPIILMLIGLFIILANRPPKSKEPEDTEN
ncbi:MAG: hypothetical protein GX775_07220 [Erysipelothrix sp.]|nr:hypothetical protein [Erysipelothrix sp.]